MDYVDRIVLNNIDCRRAYEGSTLIATIESRPPVDDPFVTFTAAGSSTIGFIRIANGQTLEYSTDKTNWSNMTAETSLSLNAGDKVYVRGTLSQNLLRTNYTQFDITGNVSLSGNINALWSYQDLTVGVKNFCGNFMFYECTGLRDISNLKFPNSIAQGCYRNMFYHCKYITTAPELPATVIGDSAYYQMFYNCTRLSYIKCLATEIQYNGTYNWVYNVASSGTFVKDANTTWYENSSGIPVGWTVIDA